MLTSRGCPYTCKFCVPNSLSFSREIDYKASHAHKPMYATRSAEKVIEEFVHLKKSGYGAISIIDDEFAIDTQRVLAICDGIKHLSMKWGCLARADTLDEEIIQAMSAAGCQYIDVGVESFSQDVLDDSGKQLDASQIEDVVALCKKHNVFLKLNILFGSSPLESKETIQATLRRLRSIKPQAVMFSICNPFPGTHYYKQAKQEGWFVKATTIQLMCKKESTISLPHISNKELEKLCHHANVMFFLNPGFVIRNLFAIKSFKELLHKCSLVTRLLFR